MTKTVRALPLAALLTILLTVAAGCSGGPKPAAQGSPEWLYAAARDSYTAGDLEKAKDHLAKIEMQGNNPFVQRARAWRIVLDAGLANAQMDIGQAYTDGWANAGAQKGSFAKFKSAHLREARRHAIHLVEGYDAFVKDIGAQPVPLDFAFPNGSGAAVAEVDRIYKGMAISEEQQSAAHRKALDRGVVRMVSSVLASPDDMASARKAMEAGRAEVSPARFLTAIGLAMNRLSGVFERKMLDEPEKMKLLRERALDAAKRALELKPEASTELAAKNLQADVEKALKAPPARLKTALR